MRKGYKYQVEGMGCIYYIIHPVTNEVRYIGQTTKTTKYRLQTHINSSKLKDSNLSKTPLGKWILKLLNNGLKPEIILIEEVPLEKLNDTEIKYIKEGRQKYRLLNVADGGVIQGRKKGSKQSKEFCERQSKERSGLKNINFIDLTGRKFKNLTVVGLVGFEGGHSVWLCSCDCGKQKILKRNRLGRANTCGCAKKDRWTPEEKKRLSDYNKANRKIKSNGQLLPVEL